MLRVNILKACLPVLCAVAVVLSTLAQNAQFPPTPTPTPTPTPIPEPTPMAVPEPVVPLPSPLSTLAPLASPSPFPTLPPLASPTPLPDGTMPLTPPPMPTPVLPDASTLSDQLNLPLPAPGQLHEPLAPGTETDTLKDSERLAMQQKMIMADFEKSLAVLIAKQRNPNVPDMTLNDAVQIALKQNPDILNAIQQIRITRGQLIQVASQAVPKIGINSQYRNQAEALTTNGRGSSGPIIGEIPNPAGGRPTGSSLPAAIALFRTKAGTSNFKAPSSSSMAGRRIMGSKAELQPTTARFSASARRSTTLSPRSSTSFTRSSSIAR